MDDNMGKYILDKLEKIDDKVDDIRTQGVETKVKLEEHDQRTKATAEKLDRVDDKLGEYNEQLKIHIRGVESLEKRQDILAEHVAPVVKAHNEKKAINKYVSDKWAARIKKATYFSILTGIVVSLLKAYSVI